MQFAKLFSPIQVGGLTLPNRIYGGSMHLGVEGVGADWEERLTAYYVERARGGAALVVTGGISPTPEGNLGFDWHLADDHLLPALSRVVAAVHRAGGRLALQLLHAGRYAIPALTGLEAVSASAVLSPSRVVPRALSHGEIEALIEAFAAAARRGMEAGFDAVELMGSEGYLLNQFFSPYTNRREDGWGGSLENRMRLGVAVVQAVRAAVGPDYPIIFRLPILELVPGGATWDEVVAYGRALAAAGVNLLNGGIGWHESRVPTISQLVPRGAFAAWTGRLRQEVPVPVVASNRINDPRQAEDLLAAGVCDLVSMARPLLADPYLPQKAATGRLEAINTCVACNQGCLDLVFSGQAATCLVNPAAGREHTWRLEPAARLRRVAVVGGGPAGLEAARVLAERGHRVTLFEAGPELGGQLRLAIQIPGKEEFRETLRYYRSELARLGVEVRLGTRVKSPADLAGYEAAVVATGVRPRRPELPGADLPHVVTYQQVLAGEVAVGRRVAVVGAGPIGVDLAHFLVAGGPVRVAVESYLCHYRLTPPGREPAGGVASGPEHPMAPPRHQVTLLRRGRRIGKDLGRTTGWAVLDLLRAHGVRMLPGVTYRQITPEGVEIEREGQVELIPADTVVLAAGQEQETALVAELQAAGLEVHPVGGARLAAELDAMRAIYEGALAGMAI